MNSLLFRAIKESRSRNLVFDPLFTGTVQKTSMPRPQIRKYTTFFEKSLDELSSLIYYLVDFKFLKGSQKFHFIFQLLPEPEILLLVPKILKHIYIVNNIMLSCMKWERSKKEKHPQCFICYFKLTIEDRFCSKNRS